MGVCVCNSSDIDRLLFTHHVYTDVNSRNNSFNKGKIIMEENYFYLYVGRTIPDGMIYCGDYQVYIVTDKFYKLFRSVGIIHKDVLKK